MYKKTINESHVNTAEQEVERALIRDIGRLGMR